MAMKWGWAEKLATALQYCGDCKEVSVKTKDGVCLKITPKVVDTVGCSFVGLSIEDNRHAVAVDSASWAEDIARCVIYLSEPLKVIEADNICGAQLRSYPPDKHEGAVSYYEFQLSADPLALDFRRWRCDGRNQKSFPVTVPDSLTWKLFTRLLDDLEATWPNRPVAAEDSSEQWNPFV